MFSYKHFLLCFVLLVGCATGESKEHGVNEAKAPLAAQADVDQEQGEVLVGAGDIAHCYFKGSQMTAHLLDTIAGTVFTAGDNVYQRGTAKEFRECYGPTWGRHKYRTRPSPGNHDYSTPDAVPYYEYFGERAGPAGLGYYSYDLGSWHIISLNSNIAAGEGSPQMEWLRADLSKSNHRCTLAYWHHPVFASTARAVSPRMNEVFAELYKSGVDVVVTGHEHVYERFAPLNDRGESDPAHGIRSFIVGTGGALPGIFGKRHPMSEVQFVKLGVIKFTLKKTSYDWQFIAAHDGSVEDHGSGVCH